MLLDTVRNPLRLIKETYNAYRNIFLVLKMVGKNKYSQTYWDDIFEMGEFDN